MKIKTVTVEMGQAVQVEPYNTLRSSVRMEAEFDEEEDTLEEVTAGVRDLLQRELIDTTNANLEVFMSIKSHIDD